MTPARLVVGCMSGTSMDGIDASLVAIEGNGLAMRASLVRSGRAALEHVAELRAFSQGAELSARSLRAIALRLGEQHRDLICSIVGGDRPDLIVLHGQTVLHEPPLSWQLVDPWPVATAFNCRVVTDLRSQSLASGGQGAPLTPLADWVLFRDRDGPRSIVNLGGFANFTLLPSKSGNAASDIAQIRGGDVCPCNLVLDQLARARLDAPCDDGGRAALAGRVATGLAVELADQLDADGARSLGTGDEALWIEDATASLAPSDALATACDAVARAITSRLADGTTAVFAGGGTANTALMRALEAHHAGTAIVSDTIGVPAQLRESIGFAVLGALASDGEAVSLPAITGSIAEGRAGQWILP